MKQVRIVIEKVTPQIDCGKYPVKAIIDDCIEVAADIWKDGHEKLKAAVLWRKRNEWEYCNSSTPAEPPPERWPKKLKKWNEAFMFSQFEYNDRWYASFSVEEIGQYAFTVIAWTDVFGSWADELQKKFQAGQSVDAELWEGMILLEKTMNRAGGIEKQELSEWLQKLRKAETEEARTRLALSTELASIMQKADPRWDLQAYGWELPIWVDRRKARFGTWYEMFPRSSGTEPSRSASFRDAEKRLPEIAQMGFDVLYLPPIHPIGRTHRKGPNNQERGIPTDPGSPWAVGSWEGGHTAIHPELGTLEDFDHFLFTARKHGMEIALDFAIQCSPDHPWVHEHPQWFLKRPDGSIKYAENPPKKYQDIYPINFETPDREGLYQALLEVILFWAGRGVRIFRVDNPHTKPISFWEWLILEAHKEYPDLIFLAEAFTRPKRMRRIAKSGFSQSYTYFTWRNSKAELEEYCSELFRTSVVQYLRPNFFVNTPDILHEVLQKGGRPAFLMRLILAATLSPTYGIYNGFELCENRPIREGSEEYLDSEKYQIKVWDWNQPGNIRDWVTRINQIRREHESLHVSHNLQFLHSTNPQMIAYAKHSYNPKDVLVTVVNVDPFQAHESMVTLPSELYSNQSSYQVCDLLAGTYYSWNGPTNYVRLEPHVFPAHLLQILL